MLLAGGIANLIINFMFGASDITAGQYGMTVFGVMMAVLKLKPAGYFLKPPVKDRLLAEIDRILDENSSRGK